MNKRGEKGKNCKQNTLHYCGFYLFFLFFIHLFLLRYVVRSYAGQTKKRIIQFFGKN